MKDYEDLTNEGNYSARYLTGKSCIVAGCNQPAGTAWSPLWCVARNISRMNQIETAYRNVERALEKCR